MSSTTGNNETIVLGNREIMRVVYVDLVANTATFQRTGKREKVYNMKQSSRGRICAYFAACADSGPGWAVIRRDDRRQRWAFAEVLEYRRQPTERRPGERMTAKLDQAIGLLHAAGIATEELRRAEIYAEAKRHGYRMTVGRWWRV